MNKNIFIKNLLENLFSRNSLVAFACISCVLIWYFTNGINMVVSLIVIGIMFFLLLYYNISFYCAAKNLNSDIKAIINNINNIPTTDRHSIINKLLVENENTKVAWNEYKETLIVIDRNEDSESPFSQRNWFSTQVAGDYINFSSLSKKIDVAGWQNLGSVFTGLGILGTFLGLTFGLYDLDMTSPDTHVLKGEIANLLGGISTAFITSLFGVVCSLIFNYFHGHLIGQLKQSISSLSILLDNNYPRKTSEFFQNEILLENSKQTGTLSNLHIDLATALAKNMEDNFGRFAESLAEMLQKQLTPTLSELKNSIDNLSNSGAEAIGKEIYDGAGEELNGFAKTLTELQSQMQNSIIETQNLGNETNKKLADMVEKFADKITESSNNALTLQQDQVNLTMSKMSATINDLQSTVKATNESFSNSISDVTDILKSTVEDSAGKQKQALEETCMQIKDILFEVNANLQQATAEMINASNNANKVLLNTVDAVKNNATEAVKTFQNGAIEQATVMGSASNSMRENIEDVINNMQKLLDNHNTAISKTYDKFEEVASKTNTIIANAGNAADKFNSAAVPVKNAIDGLTKNIVETTDANKTFYSLVTAQNENLKKSVKVNQENLQYLLSSLEKAQDSWRAYEKHFAGVSDEIERTFKALNEAVVDYNKVTSEGLSDNLFNFDNVISNALGRIGSECGSLNDSIEALVETIDDLKDLQQNMHKSN